MFSFIFTLLKANIRVFTVCKTIFILNWTKSKCPNFRVSREKELQLCWKVESGLGKIDVWVHSIPEACEHFAYHEPFVAYFVSSIQINTITVCLLCICHCHRQRHKRWCSCLMCKKTTSLLDFLCQHMWWVEVILWTCLGIVGWLFSFIWTKNVGHYLHHLFLWEYKAIKLIFIWLPWG